jgi:hypothetical protein
VRKSSLSFLKLEENPGESDYIEQLKNEVEWINKFREMGIKTPKYFKALSVIDEAGQEHHDILVARINDSFMVKPGWAPRKGFRAIFIHMNIAQSTCNASVS